MRDGEFKKFDFKSVDKNQEVYGQDEPPQYDLKAIDGHKITMVCGTDDLLVSPDDYNWLYEELADNGNQVNFLEYQLGHQGLQFPKDKSAVNHIVDQIMLDYDQDCYQKYSQQKVKVVHQIGDLNF